MGSQRDWFDDFQQPALSSLTTRATTSLLAQPRNCDWCGHRISLTYWIDYSRHSHAVRAFPDRDRHRDLGGGATVNTRESCRDQRSRRRNRFTVRPKRFTTSRCTTSTRAQTSATWRLTQGRSTSWRSRSTRHSTMCLRLRLMLCRKRSRTC